MVNKIAKEVNDKRRLAENTVALLAIQNQFSWPKGDTDRTLLKASRRFIERTDMLIFKGSKPEGKPAPGTLFLFSDALLVADHKKNGLFSERSTIQLEHLRVRKLSVVSEKWMGCTWLVVWMRLRFCASHTGDFQ